MSGHLACLHHHHLEEIFILVFHPETSPNSRFKRKLRFLISIIRVENYKSISDLSSRSPQYYFLFLSEEFSPCLRLESRLIPMQLRPLPSVLFDFLKFLYVVIGFYRNNKVRLKSVGSCFILQFPSMTINFTYQIAV